MRVCAEPRVSGDRAASKKSTALGRTADVREKNVSSRRRPLITRRRLRLPPGRSARRARSSSGARARCAAPRASRAAPRTGPRSTGPRRCFANRRKKRRVFLLPRVPRRARGGGDDHRVGPRLVRGELALALGGFTRDKYAPLLGHEAALALQGLGILQARRRRRRRSPPPPPPPRAAAPRPRAASGRAASRPRAPSARRRPRPPYSRTALYLFGSEAIWPGTGKLRGFPATPAPRARAGRARSGGKDADVKGPDPEPTGRVADSVTRSTAIPSGVFAGNPSVSTTDETFSFSGEHTTCVSESARFGVVGVGSSVGSATAAFFFDARDVRLRVPRRRASEPGAQSGSPTSFFRRFARVIFNGLFPARACLLLQLQAQRQSRSARGARARRPLRLRRRARRSSEPACADTADRRRARPCGAFHLRGVPPPRADASSACQRAELWVLLELRDGHRTAAERVDGAGRRTRRPRKPPRRTRARGRFGAPLVRTRRSPRARAPSPRAALAQPWRPPRARTASKTS